MPNFLQKEISGLPVWGWGLIIVAGVGAAVLLPKFFGGQASSSDASGQGLGLAIDPTTGLPYAVEGLVPSGGTTGGGGTDQSGQNPPKPPVKKKPEPPKKKPVPPKKPPVKKPPVKATAPKPLPAGTIVYPGEQGRWWYMSPGGSQKLLFGGEGAYLPSTVQRIYPGPQGRWWYLLGGKQYPLVPTAPQIPTEDEGVQKSASASGIWPNADTSQSSASRSYPAQAASSRLVGTTS